LSITIISYLADLISASKNKPINFLSSNTFPKELQTGLESMGIHFSNPFQTVEVKTVIEAAYGKRDYDINFLGAMVVGSDPDGLYHVLGKSGALTSPAIARTGVHETLESARSLSGTMDLHPHYMNVSRKIFEEVPMIHISFHRNGALFDSEKIQTKDCGLNSERFVFDGFTDLVNFFFSRGVDTFTNQK